MIRDRPEVGRMLGRALVRRCPRCGRGGLSVFYPYSKTLWAAIDMLPHRMDPQDADTAWGGDERD